MTPRVQTIVPAAGLSSRMSGFKPLEFLDGATALARVVRAHLEGGVERVIVVVGHRADEVEAAAAAAGADTVYNSEYKQGMFTSIQAGARGLAPGIDGFFLHPVDIPLVRPETVQSILAARGKSSPSVLHPVFLGERGHPPLMPAFLRDAITAWDGPRGMLGLMAELESVLIQRDVAVADAGVVMDMDTDANLADMRRRAAAVDMPAPEECRAALDMVQATERMRLHGRAVAAVAVHIGRALNAKRNATDRLDLIHLERAGLLHDIAKGARRHEEEGGRMLAAMGFHAIVDSVASHRDIDPAAVSMLGEREVVFMADKLVAGGEQVTVRERYGRVLERHGHDPDARTAIERRRAHALAMQVRMEEKADASLDAVVAEALRAIA